MDKKWAAVEDKEDQEEVVEISIGCLADQEDLDSEKAMDKAKEPKGGKNV